MSDRKAIFINIFYTGVLTATGVILFYVMTGGSPLLTFMELLMVSCVVGVILGFLNSLFLMLFSITTYGKLILKSRPVCFIEVGVFFIALYIVKFVMDLVPLDYQFTESGNVKYKSIFFDEFKILYAFLIVLGLLYLLKSSLLKFVARRK